MNNKNETKQIAMISVHSDPLAKIGSIEAGGQNIYVKHLTRELDKLGWTVDVFTRNDSSDKKAVVKIGRRSRVIRIAAGPRHFIPKNMVFKYLPDFIKNFLVWRARENRQYILTHGNYYEAGWVSMQIKRILDIPMTQTFHSLGMVRYKTLLKYKEQPINSGEFLFRLRVENEIMDVADKIIATSPFELEDMKQYYALNPDKAVIVPVGVDPHLFRALDKKFAFNELRRRHQDIITPDTKILLYVGRIEWRKGLGTLIASLRELKRINPKVRDQIKLLIVGASKQTRNGKIVDTEEVTRLKNQSAELKVADMVHFLGSVPQDQLSTYYSAAEISLIPSYYEPFGIVPMEAMLCRTPVIASRTGGLQYTVKHNLTGLSIKPRRPRLLAQAINRLLKNPKLAERLSKNAFNRVQEKFIWKKIAMQIAETYTTMTNHYEAAKTS